jgi:putative membrane protein
MAQSDETARKTGEEFRLRMQIEITLLVWVRTSLALMGFGFVVARFGMFLREIARVGDIHVKGQPRLAGVSTFTGTALIVLGVVVLLLSVWGHQRLVAHLERGELSLPSRWSLGVILSFILAALGVTLAIYLTAVES